jgi:hypothetical protein
MVPPPLPPYPPSVYRPASSYLRNPAPGPDPYSPYNALYHEPPQIELPDDIDDNAPSWRDEEPPRRPRSPVAPSETPQFSSDEALARQLQLEEHRRARAVHLPMRYHPPPPPAPYHAWRRGGGGHMAEEDAPVAPLGGAPMGGLLGFLARRFNAQRVNPLAALMFVDRDFNENDYEMLLALDDTAPKVKGASVAEIDEHLRRHVVQPGEEDKCAVCLEEMTAGEEVRKLTCRHLFHFECVSKWLLINKVCPIDKRAIDE